MCDKSVVCRDRSRSGVEKRDQISYSMWLKSALLAGQYTTWSLWPVRQFYTILATRRFELSCWRIHSGTICRCISVPSTILAEQVQDQSGLLKSSHPNCALGRLQTHLHQYDLKGIWTRYVTTLFYGRINIYYKQMSDSTMYVAQWGYCSGRLTFILRSWSLLRSVWVLLL